MLHVRVQLCPLEYRGCATPGGWVTPKNLYFRGFGAAVNHHSVAASHISFSGFSQRHVMRQVVLQVDVVTRKLSSVELTGGIAHDWTTIRSDIDSTIVVSSTSTSVDRFPKYFHSRLSSKFVITTSAKTPPHLRYKAATLRCEMFGILASFGLSMTRLFCCVTLHRQEECTG